MCSSAHFAGKWSGGAKLTTDLRGPPSDTCAGFSAGFCVRGHGCAEAFAIATGVARAGVGDAGLEVGAGVHLGAQQLHLNSHAHETL